MSCSSEVLAGDIARLELRNIGRRSLLENKQRATIVARTSFLLHQLYSFDGVDQPEEVISSYPNPDRVIEALKVLIDVMFPGKTSSGVSSPAELLPFLEERLMFAGRILGTELERAIPFRWRGAASKDRTPPRETFRNTSETVLERFFEQLPGIRQTLIEDIRAAYEGDPAAMSYAEIKIAYPGTLAVISHRLAHELYKLNVPIVPRIMSEWTHTQTGIDIHPGAQIAAGFFVDHGTGVVIGETAIIGKNVRIYQGVTLGTKSFELDENGHPKKQVKRHPTLEDDVIIYSNAVVLGGDTVIGKGSVIGSAALVVESIPPGSVVTAKRPELRIKQA